MKRFKISTNIDWTLIAIPLLLATSSVATLFSITSISGNSSLAIDQIVYFIIGASLYWVFAALNYRELKNYYIYLYLIGIISLVAVIFFGQSVYGSTRWINFGFTRFQPSELMKMLLIIFGASYFSRGKENTFYRVFIFLLLSAIPLVMVARQPDLGTTLTMLVIVVAIALASKLPRKILIGGVVTIIILLPIAWISLKPYQKERVVSFANPAADPLGSGYNVSQSKIAVGSGGLTGKGFGETTQSQLQFLPVAHIDFIFSGWAEATGFVGSFLMVVAFSIMIYRIFIIATVSQDEFGTIFCIGAGAMIFFQSFVNIGMNIGLMPVTGIPLPLVSYGGTSIITTAIVLGIVQSINIRHKTLKFE